MVRGHVWKPKADGRWHWQLIIREATKQAHVYSGHEVEHRAAVAAMRSAYAVHHNPFGVVIPDLTTLRVV